MTRKTSHCSQSSKTSVKPPRGRRAKKPISSITSMSSQAESYVAGPGRPAPPRLGLALYGPERPPKNPVMRYARVLIMAFPPVSPPPPGAFACPKVGSIRAQTFTGTHQHHHARTAKTATYRPIRQQDIAITSRPLAVSRPSGGIGRPTPPTSPSPTPPTNASTTKGLDDHTHTHEGDPRQVPGLLIQPTRRGPAVPSHSLPALAPAAGLQQTSTKARL